MAYRPKESEAPALSYYIFSQDLIAVISWKIKDLWPTLSYNTVPLNSLISTLKYSSFYLLDYTYISFALPKGHYSIQR